MKVIDSPVNVKQGGGRNRALAAASGKYVMFLDADDRLREDALELCVKAAVCNDSEAVFFDYCNYAPSTGSTGSVSQLGDDASRLSGDELRLRIIRRTSPVWSAMYARHIITDNELWFPEGVFYEDNAVALAMQLVARNPVKINEPLYYYRCDNPSVSRTKGDMRFFDRIGSAVTLLGHVRRLGVYDAFSDEIDWLFVNQYLIHTIYGAIYRFDRVQEDRIREVREGVGRYVGDFRSLAAYRRLPLKSKLKIETHLRFPGLIKRLSNINRRLNRKL